MFWIKAFHIIFMTAWFSGLFYLPRIFVYHTLSRDEKMNARFELMEKRLYYYLMHPSAALTIIFGAALIYFNPQIYLQASWMQIKLGLVLLLLVYHFYLSSLLRAFKNKQPFHSDRFYRWINEIPTVFLIIIVILVVVRPVV